MRLSVLIVDDSESFLEAARRLLEREGLSVVGVASTSADAVRQALGEPPDVILVDVFLGDESGFVLARELADALRSSETIVVLISTYDRRDFEDLLAQTPAAGFLSKTELSANAVRQILESANGSRGT